jgi:nitronate monooxygenase
MNDLCKLLKIQYPIIQAPMILQKPLLPLASAVSISGGLGSLGCAEMSVNEIASNVASFKLTTVQPFNLNFFLHEEPKHDESIDADTIKLLEPFYKEARLTSFPNSKQSSLGAFNDEILSLLVKLKTPVVSFHFGTPKQHVVEALKASGTTILATATTVAEAIKLEEGGVDIVVAQGWEAGGHRGSFNSNYEDVGIGSMALIPQVVDAISIPVIAAGGIGDGRGIAAALALGASGVQMGTAFLSCSETPITPQHRSVLRNAYDEDTALTRAFSGRPCRGKRNRYLDVMSKYRQLLPEFPTMYNFTSPLKQYGIEIDSLDFQFFLYGQAASLNREMSAGKLIRLLIEETNEALKIPPIKI